MEIHIGQLMSVVRALDDDALIAPDTLRDVVAAVLDASREADEHHERVASEQRVGSGLWEQRMGGGRHA